MIDSSLYHRLSPVARRFQMRRLFTTLAVVWCLATMGAIVLWTMKANGSFHSLWSMPILLATTLFATMLAAWWSLRSDENFKDVVKEIETRHPELDAALITAVQQQPATANGTLGYLQQQVVRKAVYHGYQNSWSKIIPQWQMLIAPLLAGFALFSLIGASVGQMFLVSTPEINNPRSGAQSTAPLAGEKLIGDFAIEPGDVEVERFTSLMVLARFAEDHLPSSAEVVIVNQDETGTETRLTMNKSLDDPIFGARIGSVKQPLQYSVHFDGRTSETYQVTVFEYPRLIRADAKLQFPAYTGMEDKVSQDVRRVSAVRGTKLRWELNLNKPIASGRLLSKDGQEFKLVPDPSDDHRYLVDMPVMTSAKLKLELIDDQQRKNKVPPTLSIQVLGNKPVVIRQLAPGADTEVSPIEELTLAATFWDDFGVEKAGIAYQVVGDDEKEISLGESLEAKKKHQKDHVLAFEELQAKPNQLLTFYFWAEDLDDAGEIRRTFGDIHLITVRDFESIFRQGQAQQQGGQQGGGGGGGGGGEGGNAQQLAELQKEIVYAIWNLKRREIFDSVTDSFTKDATVIAESQQTALDQVTEMATQLPDPSMAPIVEKIQILQSATVGHLNDSVEKEEAELLSEALKTAQAAFQAMLALRQIEMNVNQQQQQQPQQGGGQGGQRQRQQMQQLQLENDENRYQNEQLASEREETSEARENRQVLSRLRELARRQNDLNERIKELQSALEEAETEDEKEEIEKQLKRLRDEQQQILRDAEELQERMENETNQSQMSEQAEQLEQARENARRSSEALEQGDTSQAAAEGTRALRDMEELRDEFQNRSSGQFDQQMQEMRNEARDIENRQQEISEAMQQGEQQRPRSNRLTDTKEETELDEQLEQQRERVEELRQSMQDTIEEAESFEPLLAERLYDTYRETLQESPADALESSARSLRAGFEDDAKLEEQRAARGIERMREGIDSAAEAVLGDETEALRRADRELQRLTRQLESEAERGDPNAEEQSANGRGSEGDEPEKQEGSERGRPSEGNQRGEGEESQDGQGRGEPSDEDPEGQGRGQGERDSQGEGEREQPSEGQGGEPGEGGQQGEGGEGQQEQDGQQPSNARGQGEQQTPRQGRGQGRPSLTQQTNQQQAEGGVGANPNINYDQESWADPITGDDDFRQWSDRMRDIEEMVADPEMRAEAARIRENARSIRRDIKRHSSEPNWELIRLKVINPLVQLQDRVHEELIRRSGDKSLVPIDRDPVPAEFENAVEDYFEKLGQGQ